ncbi:TPA: DUF488 family protein, partial [Pasteurella multocida]|nr:DUF488 family protein [Pasteurella multocida]HDR1687928.1 DUF488 family protein [Pasteurella multocida]
YGDTEERFFSKLVNENIRVFIDVRQRRGMRGKKYSFVNSSYLQQKLKQLDIEYLYIKDLAPTKNIREFQREQDILNNESKSSRSSLSHLFIDFYETEILEKFNIQKLIESIGDRTPIRFSLARWWTGHGHINPFGVAEERAYLQISGFYI